MADQFDYNTQQQQIAYQRAMAKRLNDANAQATQGQMVDGWYVAPPKAAIWGNALSNIAGGLLEGKAQRDDQELSKKDREVYNRAINNLLNPDDESLAQRAKDAVPLPQDGYTYKDPEAVGPNRDTMNGVAATPVGSGSMEVRDLPPGPVPITGPALPPDPKAQAALLAPQGLIETPPSAPGAIPPQAQAATPGQDFNVTPADPAAVSAAWDKRRNLFERASNAQRMQAMQELATTKEGGPLSRTLIQAQLANQLSPKWDKQVLNNPDGSQRLIQVDQKGRVRTLDAGTTGALKPADALAREEFEFKKGQDSEKKGKERQEQVDSYDLQLQVSGNARRQVSSLLNPAKGQAGAKDANGVTGKFGAFVTSATGIPTRSAEARARIEGLKANFLQIAMANQKALAGTATGMSEKESMAAMAALESLNPDMGDQAIETALRQADNYIGSQEEAIKSKRQRALGGGSAAPGSGSLNTQQQSFYSSVFKR